MALYKYAYDYDYVYDIRTCGKHPSLGLAVYYIVYEVPQCAYSMVVSKYT